jgi:hypothetical protein
MSAFRFGLLQFAFSAVLVSSCSVYQSKTHNELIGSSLDSAFAQISQKPSYDTIIPVAEARRLYTSVAQAFPLSDRHYVTATIRVINWNAGDRFIRILSRKEHGKWIIFDVLDIPAEKSF